MTYNVFSGTLNPTQSINPGDATMFDNDNDMRSAIPLVDDLQREV